MHLTLIDLTKVVWQFNNGYSLSLPSFNINFFTDQKGSQLLKVTNITGFYHLLDYLR